MRYKLMRPLMCLMMLLVVGMINAQSDSIRIVDLGEAVLQAQAVTETTTHSIIVPSSLDKAHSSNAFDMLHAMNLSGLDVSYNAKQVFNSVGKEVDLCINGIEASADEIAALRSKSVVSIEFQRTPDGKYAGSGGVLNFKTVQYEYGGNFLITAKESFLYNGGEYLASADYHKSKSRLALLYSNNWGLQQQKQIVNNNYVFANGDKLHKESLINPLASKEIANTVNLRFSNKGDNYRISLLGAFSDKNNPYYRALSTSSYKGSVQETATASIASSSYDEAFFTKANYSLWLPNRQVVDITAFATSGRNVYRYDYSETNQSQINTRVEEDNASVSGMLQYFKTFHSGMNFSTIVDYHYSFYNDIYDGTVTGTQVLENHVSSIRWQLSKGGSKHFYYISAGLSNMNIRLNESRYHYLNPTANYGINYTPQNNHAISFTGFYVNTLFSPSNKNDIAVPSSFFEMDKGNPNLKPINVLSHTLEYNHAWNNTSLTASYMNYNYFNNILHVYEVDDKHIYSTVSNDGNFYGNMLTLTVAQKFCEDRLQIALTAIEEYNMLKGNVYNLSKNVLRAKLKIDYRINKTRIGFEAASPYNALDIREPYFVEVPLKATLYAMWNWKNWNLEASIHNPWSQYAVTERYMNYSCYDMQTEKYDLKEGRTVALKVTYNFGYGKTTSPENYAIESILNSAIMKSHE